jgi:glucose 1-dehydrogenase
MDSKNLEGHVAIVTGAGQGIGLEIARMLCSQGASVVLNDLDPKLAEQGCAKIVAQGGTCIAVAGDVGDSKIIQLLVDTAVKKFGKLTLCVPNAGITLFAKFLEFSEASFDKVIQTNLKGGFFLAQAASKQMVKQNSGGSILFMSSVTGHQAHENLSAYGMTKAALENLTKHLVLELSKYKIRVNAIAPGATLTERTTADEKYHKVWSSITPIGKPATVQDIAHAALFLLSDKAGHITGQSLVVDGGWTVVGVPPY